MIKKIARLPLVLFAGAAVAVGACSTSAAPAPRITYTTPTPDPGGGLPTSCEVVDPPRFDPSLSVLLGQPNIRTTVDRLHIDLPLIDSQVQMEVRDGDGRRVEAEIEITSDNTFSIARAAIARTGVLVFSVVAIDDFGNELGESFFALNSDGAALEAQPKLVEPLINSGDLEVDLFCALRPDGNLEFYGNFAGPEDSAVAILLTQTDTQVFSRPTSSFSEYVKPELCGEAPLVFTATTPADKTVVAPTIRTSGCDSSNPPFPDVQAIGRALPGLFG